MKRLAWAWENPVLIKEIRTRMRGNRAFVLFTTHLLILVLVISLVYAFSLSSLSANSSLEQRRISGKMIFGLLLWMELLTVSFLAPALTSGMISTERERQTFDLVRVTLLPARSLVLGKFTAGLAFIFLLLFTSLPLQGPAFLVGGVLPEEILIGILILVVTAIAFCALGMFFSSLFSRTQVSTTLTYAVAITLVFGIPMIFLIILSLFGGMGASIDRFSPAQLSVLLILGWLLVCITPLATMIGTEIYLLQERNLWLIQVPLNNQVTVKLLSPWIVYIAVYLIISLILIWQSIRLVRRVEK
jgi:ABC-2 type transport system permease protein